MSSTSRLLVYHISIVPPACLLETAVLCSWRPVLWWVKGCVKPAYIIFPPGPPPRWSRGRGGCYFPHSPFPRTTLSFINIYQLNAGAELSNFERGGGAAIFIKGRSEWWGNTWPYSKSWKSVAPLFVYSVKCRRRRAPPAIPHPPRLYTLNTLILFYLIKSLVLFF